MSPRISSPSLTSPCSLTLQLTPYSMNSLDPLMIPSGKYYPSNYTSGHTVSTTSLSQSLTPMTIKKTKTSMIKKLPQDQNWNFSSKYISSTGSGVKIKRSTKERSSVKISSESHVPSSAVASSATSATSAAAESDTKKKLKQYQRDMIAQVQKVILEGNKNFNTYRIPQNIMLQPIRAGSDGITPFELGGRENNYYNDDDDNNNNNNNNNNYDDDSTCEYINEGNRQRRFYETMTRDRLFHLG